MGKVMSFMGKKAIQPIKNYNIEARAHKVISKEKPKPAPHHPQRRAISQDVIEESMKIQKLKENEFAKRLSQVYVTSHDPEDPAFPEPQIPNRRPLPDSRKCVEEPEYGFHEPNKIPYGRSTLRKIIHFINDHQVDSEKWTAKEIAYDHKLSLENTENILKYYSVLSIRNPEVKVQSKLDLYEPAKSLPDSFPMPNLDEPSKKDNIDKAVPKPA